MPSPRHQDYKEAQSKFEQKDRGLVEGMIKEEERTCQDGCCCAVFLLFIFALVGLSGFAFANGNPALLLTKFDSDGNECGQPAQTKSVSNSSNGIAASRDFSPYKKKYFSNLLAIMNVQDTNTEEPQYTASICVDKCPTSIQSDPVGCQTNWEVGSCPGGKGNPNKIPFNTTDVLGFCVPNWEEVETNSKVIIEKIDQLAGGNFTRYMFDIAESWQVLLVMAFVSMVITLLFLWLLSCIMAPLLYISILLFLVCGVAFTAFCFYQWSEIPEGYDNKNYALGLGILSAVLTVLYIVCLCCVWGSIQIGIDVLKVTARFVRSNTRLVLAPFINFLVLIPIIAWWLAFCLYLYTIGTPRYERASLVAAVDNDMDLAAVWWVILFGIIWLICFFIAVQQFTTGVAAINWYFTGQGSDVEGVQGSFSVFTGVSWAFKFYPGSLAYGSFLIAVVTLIKFVFEYFAKKAEALSAEENIGAIVKCFLCCARCCIWCVDCCVRFISEMAYLKIAIEGQGFCTSAQEAFYMTVRHPGSFSATSTIGFLMSFIGKGFITALTGFLTYLACDQMVEGIEQPIVPAFIGGIIGFMTSSLFLQLFDFTSLAILMSFLTNKECGGTIAAPEELKEHFDNWEKDQEEYAKRLSMEEQNGRDTGHVDNKANAMD